MATQHLASAAVMGGLALVVLLAVRYGRGWYSYEATSYGDDHANASAGAEGGMEYPPLYLVFAFFFVVAGLLWATNVFVTGGAMSAVLPGVALATVGTIATVYGFAKVQGHGNAMAAFETATVAGTLFLVAILLQVVVS